jgi:tetratricopeptide (TPR) repeat protein
LPKGDLGANLERAIACYQAALRVHTERDFPADWAGTQNNLGSAYVELPTGDRGANLEQAIACFQAARRVYTERDFPANWAMTQNNLGVAYADLPTGDRGANLEQAIACYQAALRVRTPDRLPLDCQQTLDNLGALYFGGQSWEKALDYYAQCIVLTEQIRTFALDEPSRRRILQESWRVFERAVVCATQTGQYGLALTLTERGKTRNLADQLWGREVKPRGVSEQDWAEYQEHLARARALERSLSGAERGVVVEPHRQRGAVVSASAILDELAALRRSAQELEARFAQADPDYVPLAPPLQIQDISEVAKATRAVIVEFRVTSEGTYVFLLGPADGGVARDQVVELPGFTSEALRQVLVEWLRSYYTRQADWPSYLQETTGKLYDQLWAPVHQRFRERYPEADGLILVPNQGLNLLPLHACWWPAEGGELRYLLDEYEIAYTPSCQVLKRCLARAQSNGRAARSLFAVQNPDGSLPFADWEVEQIAPFFPEENRRVLKGPQATLAAIKAGLRSGEEKLFSCHGRYDLEEVERSHLQLHSEEVLSLPDIVPRIWEAHGWR